MTMHNPPHPGEFIAEVFLKPNGGSIDALAMKLCLEVSAVHRLLEGIDHVSPEVVQRLSDALGRSADSWLAMQREYELSQTGYRGEPRSY